MKVLERIHGEREQTVRQLADSLPTLTKEDAQSDHTQLFEAEEEQVAERVNPRSPAILDYIEETFGVRFPNRQRKTWDKVRNNRKYPAKLRALANQIFQLSEAGSDATWIGRADADAAGLTFSKVDSKGFVYPQYNLVGSPDRPTCTGVNIQNFPRPGDDPRVVPLRQAVIPPEEGMVLIAADFSKIESFTQAIEAGDWERVRYVQSRDFHRDTAEFLNRTLGLTLTRHDGKTCNHAFDKGESATNLALRLFGNRTANSRQRAEDILASLLQPFPETRRFRDALGDRARCSNPLIIQNRFGRRLECFARTKYQSGEDYLTGDKRYEQQAHSRWKAALAFLGRSCAVDVLLRVMSKVYYEERLDNYSTPYAEVHDELVCAVPREDAAKYAKTLQVAFEEPVAELDGFSIPCEVKIGNNWAECH